MVKRGANRKQGILRGCLQAGIRAMFALLSATHAGVDTGAILFMGHDIFLFRASA